MHKIESNEKPPAERPAIIAWEQRNTTFLPEDLKNFFMTSDGFNMNWSVVMESEQKFLFLSNVAIGYVHHAGVEMIDCFQLFLLALRLHFVFI